MAKLKIGIECENLEDPKSRWGIGKITLNLLKEFANNPEWQKRYKLYLYFKNHIPDDDFFKIHNSKFKIRILGFPSFNIFYHILMPLRAMMDRVDWMFFPAYQLPPLYFGKSVVVLTEDAYYEYKYGVLPFRYKLSYRIFTNWAAKFATKILAISETSKKEVARVYKIRPDKIFVNYLGIDIGNVGNVGHVGDDRNEKTNPTQRSQVGLDEAVQQNEVVKQALRQSNNSNYLLFAGQAFPRRHLKETILAFEKIVPEFSDLKLIAIGPDKYEKPTIKLLAEEVNKKLGGEKIIYKERVSDEELSELYAGAKMLVYVSDREAFGLPPMEALSFGVPPVVMDNELGHELFREYAFYSKSGNADDITDAIKQVLSDENPSTELMARIKNSGPEFVKRYNWKNFASRWLQIIDEK